MAIKPTPVIWLVPHIGFCLFVCADVFVYACPAPQLNQVSAKKNGSVCESHTGIVWELFACGDVFLYAYLNQVCLRRRRIGVCVSLS